MASTPKASLSEGLNIFIAHFGHTAGANRYGGNTFHVFRPGTAGETRRSGWSPIIAKRIDVKLDDGLPKTGNISCTGMGSDLLFNIPQIANQCVYYQWPDTCDTGAGNNAYSTSQNGECGTAFLNKF